MEKKTAGYVAAGLWIFGVTLCVFVVLSLFNTDSGKAALLLIGVGSWMTANWMKHQLAKSEVS